MNFFQLFFRFNAKEYKIQWENLRYIWTLSTRIINVLRKHTSESLSQKEFLRPSRNIRKEKTVMASSAISEESIVRVRSGACLPAKQSLTKFGCAIERDDSK